MGQDFIIRATDMGGLSVDAAFTVTVEAVNDSPTTSGVGDVTVLEDASETVIDLFASFGDIEDSDSELIYSISSIGEPTLFMSTAINGLAGSLTLDYASNQNGASDFTVRATDSGGLFVETTFNVEVTPVNDVPIAVADSFVVDEDNQLSVPADGVLTNDDDVDGDQLTTSLVTDTSNGELQLSADGSFVYMPDENFNGTDSFEYSVSDNTSESNVVTVTITVNPVNDLPVATSESFTIGQFEVLAMQESVLANDADIDNDDLTVVLVSEPEHGELTLNEDGTFTFLPDDNFFGIDSFDYAVNDGSESSTPTTVFIEVTQLAPAAVSVESEPAPSTSEPQVEDDSVDEDITENETSETTLELTTEITDVEDQPTTAFAVAPPQTVVEDDDFYSDVTTLDSEQDDILLASLDTSNTRFLTLGKLEDVLRSQSRRGNELRQSETQSTLNATEFETDILWGQFDAFQKDIRQELDADLSFESLTVGATSIMATGLSVGYVIWMVRGGALLASMLSVVPGWRFVDLLPVLDSFEHHNFEDVDDETLEEMVELES